MRKIKLAFHKILHWEYWPYQIVYIPVYFQYLYYVLRTRSFFYVTASNPGIKNGGFFLDSKKEIYDLIPQQFYPKTLLITKETPFTAILNSLQLSELHFPLIAKPDIGLRGTAVKKIHSQTELFEYNEKANFNYLVQAVIPYENEIGLFYVKLPNSSKGKITGIVAKEFLIITGDGKTTIRDFLLQNPRYALQLKTLEKEYGDQLNTVLEEGEKRNLVPYGNHCRGTKFFDYSSKITPQLEETFTKICDQIEGFDYGRMDIMFSNFEDLEVGKNFQIVEINGAISEPTHIYDPNHSLFFGWKELMRHHHYLYQVSKYNNRKKSSYLSLKKAIQSIKKHNSSYNTILKF